MLMTEYELKALERSCYKTWIDQAILNDPDFGWTGSGEYYCVYFKYDLSPTDMLGLGREVQKWISAFYENQGSWEGIHI